MKINFNNIIFDDFNLILVDGLREEDIKAKYSWLLNTRYKNAIIGQNSYGIVWYSGEWLDGDWYDGTWYSGIFHQGIWENGNFYSYKLDLNSLKLGKFVILEENKIYSHFLNGTWNNGKFYNGTFGIDQEYWDNNTTYNINNIKSLNGYNKDWEISINSNTIWENGNFYNGYFINSLWQSGNFYNGTIYNGYWLNGNFYNGNFINYYWENGNMYGGNFREGIWNNGNISTINQSIPAIFGNSYNLTSDTILTIFNNGNINNSYITSGNFIDISGNTIKSINNNITLLNNGNFYNNKFYGGHLAYGYWFSGDWYNGIFGQWSSDWIYPKNVTEIINGTVGNFNGYTNLIDSDPNTYCQLVITSSDISSGISNLLKFDFGTLNSNNINNTAIIYGIKVRIKRSGYFNKFFGYTQDNLLLVTTDNSDSYPSDYDTTLIRILNGQSPVYSYNNTYNDETIYYGLHDELWNISNIPLDTNIYVKYKASIISESYLENHKNILDYSSKIESFIKDIAIKVFYTLKPYWYNGTWYDGLWLNGNWYNGKFKQGTWINGDFYNGEMNEN
jgi:hypothetical protein